MAKPEHVGWPF